MDGRGKHHASMGHANGCIDKIVNLPNVRIVGVG
jgi:hypothetical protein